MDPVPFPELLEWMGVLELEKLESGGFGKGCRFSEFESSVLLLPVVVRAELSSKELSISMESPSGSKEAFSRLGDSLLGT